MTAPIPSELLAAVPFGLTLDDLIAARDVERPPKDERYPRCYGRLSTAAGFAIAYPSMDTASLRRKLAECAVLVMSDDTYRLLLAAAETVTA